MRVVIVGAGEVGRHLARSLHHETELILVDSDPVALAAAEENIDALSLVGDATHRDVLARAEVGRADLLVAVTPSDTTNLVCAALARSVGTRQTVARVDDPSFFATDLGFERGVLGIDAVLCASRLVSVELLRMLAGVRAQHVIPAAAGLVHVATHRLGEDSPLVRGRGRTTNWPDAIAGVVRGGHLRPVAEVEHAELGDVVLICGSPTTVLGVLHDLTPASGVVRTTIVGGGDVGAQLARLLGPRGLLDRVIERSRPRCQELAEQLEGAQVLHGDGTNLAFLREEQVGRADALLAVTGSDEANLMTSLLAREVGVDHVFALVHRPGYAGVYSHLGVSGTVSPHETVAQVIHWLLPRGALVGRTALPELGVEVIELRVPASIERVADLPLPPGSVVLAIANQGVRSARGRTNLVPGEHVIAVVPAARSAMLDKSLARLDRKGGGA
jgi:trk system potassium uptake protein TrkA